MARLRQKQKQLPNFYSLFKTLLKFLFTDFFEFLS